MHYVQIQRGLKACFTARDSNNNNHRFTAIIHVNLR